MPIRKLLSFIKPKSKVKLPDTARILPRNEHTVSRKSISPNALKVLYRLNDHKYKGYLVGGCVRDLLLGREPKDFDVATNATPNQVRSLFRNGRIIGRRFRIVHILFRQEIIEVSTFRAHQDESTQDKKSDEGMLLRDNVFGTIVDDAKRRDFTVNALYYSASDFTVLDFHNGLEDLQKGILRIIGDPILRYREDPVRMLRAIRFAAKLGFRIETKTEQPIFELRSLLANIAPARLFTEVLKLFLGGQALATFKLLRHYEVLEFLFPAVEYILNHEDYAHTDVFITLLLQDTDARLSENKTVSPAFLIAGLLWHRFNKEQQAQLAEGHNIFVAKNLAYNVITSEQQAVASVPKHFFLTAKTIWEMQYNFENPRSNKCLSLLNHSRFRAGFDFLKLRHRAGEALDTQVKWWEDFYTGSQEQKELLLEELKKNEPKKRRKRKPKPRK